MALFATPRGICHSQLKRLCSALWVWLKEPIWCRRHLVLVLINSYVAKSRTLSLYVFHHGLTFPWHIHSITTQPFINHELLLFNIKSIFHIQLIESLIINLPSQTLGNFPLIYLIQQRFSQIKEHLVSQLFLKNILFNLALISNVLLFVGNH